MKKMMTILCIALIAFSVMSCDSKKTDKNVIRVGMDLKFPPFSYVDDKGNAGGFEPIVAKAFAEFLGKEVEIVNTDFSMLIPALDTGDVDILIADMSRTDERAQKADFSNPYRYTYTLALVNKDFATKNAITDTMSEQDFFAIDGARFTGLSGTMGVYYPQKYGINVSEVTEIGTGLLEISKGMADVLVASNEVHGFHFADKENTVVYSGIEDFNASRFAVKKGNTELLQKANEFIATLYEDDGLYDGIKSEWDPIIAEFLKAPELGLDYIVNPAK